MRSESHGVVRHLERILPVLQFNCSADEFFGCDGIESFEKVFAMEILNAHMHAPDTRVDVPEETDIMCPGWLSEQFISQLLPRVLSSCIADCVTDFNTPVEACAWLEDLEMNSRIVVRKIEAYMQNLPDAWRFNESLHQDILQTYFHAAKEFECLKLESSTKPQVQYVIQPGPYAIPLARDGGCKEGISVLQILLVDAGSNLENVKTVYQKSVKVFELKPSDQDSLLEQYYGQIRHKELEEYTKAMDIQNLVGRVGESEVKEPITKLLDFDPADFLLDKLHIRGNSVQHKLQPASSASSVIGGLSLLDENSAAADISNKYAAMNCTIKGMFELPEVLEDRYLDSILTLKLGSYISTSMKPNSVELENLDSQEIAFQDLEKLVILPELILQTSRFHFLQVPSFISDHQARIPEDVFKAVFRAKSLASSTSASDWVYLDWHLSQVGHCNNHGCFHLQRRVIKNELDVKLQRDEFLVKRMPDYLLLLSLTKDSLHWHRTEKKCGNNKEVYSAAYLHASASIPLLNFSSSLYKAAKAADKNLSDQSVSTHEPRNNFSSVRDQVPVAGSGPTSMDRVLSLIKQARQGELLKDTKSMQASENESYQEGYQSYGNTKKQSHDRSPEECQASKLASTAVKIPAPNIRSSSDIDAALSYNLQASNRIARELQVPLHIPVCPSKELPQEEIKPAPPLPPDYVELSPQQSEANDLIQLCSGQGPHLIVVANILQPSGSIFLQRRSSYQKILGLENEDLQVVERELKLPVDLILNPSTCLTVYTEDKLLRCAKSSSPKSEEFFSNVMDMIVHCHMKALSFSFRRWFMIFEGDLTFNSAINHVLNKLYICSAAFQMRVQGFISTDPTSTDSIVLSCIKMIWKTSKRPFNSPMSEDLTDGEVCLSTFPSFNPLSSHAMLCLNVPIATFISWSCEEQHRALQDIDIQAESLNLLKAQVLYGKLETSAFQKNVSVCPWSTASEKVALEIGMHAQAGFTYFPPASEITGCEFEEDPGGVLPREGQCDLCPPSYPDPIVPYDSAEQSTSAWSGVCWPHVNGEPVTFANPVNHRTQQRNCLEEKDGCHNAVDVPGILQQLMRRRKGVDKDVNYSDTESELYCDTFKAANDESYRAQLCVSRFPSSVKCTTHAVYPSYRNKADDELRWAPWLTTSGKRPISAVEQYRQQRGVPLALRSHKKLKPAVPSDRSIDNETSSQLDHSLKISRQSCYKFNSPFGRTI